MIKLRLFLALLLIFTAFITTSQASIDSTEVILEELQSESCLDNNQALGDLDQKVAYINGLYEKVLSESRFSDVIDANVTVDLPRGIKKTIGGRDYVVLVDTIHVTPKGAWINVYCVLELPWNGNRVYFSADHIELTPGGLTGAFNLSLVKEIPIPFGKNTLTILADNSATYVKFACDGFQSFGFKARYDFSPDILIPEDSNGTVNKNGKVSATFAVQGTDLSDIVAQVSINPFQVKGLDGFGFYVSEAILDLSDLNNPTGIKFPNDYQPVLDSYGVPALWQGFYMHDLTVKIPNKFKGKDLPRTEIGVQDLIVDHQGVTGLFFGKGLIPIEKGDLGGWSFSLDSLGVRILVNQLVGVGFNGQLRIPIMKNDEQLAYDGSIEINSNYHFGVTTQSQIEFPLWAAKVELDSGSTVQVDVDGDDFRPKAILTGKISITVSFGKDKGSGSSVPGISFEKLTVQTVSPYLSAERFSLDNIGGGGSTVSKFPITLNSIGWVTEGDKVGVSIDIAVHFTKSEDKGFSGEAALRVMGKMLDDGVHKSWQFDNVYLDKIKIDIDNDAFKLKGELDIYRQDPIYGEGFKGTIDASFKPGIDLGVTAQFGNVNGFRYWYVDAHLVLPTGIPIFTGVGIYGFVGGAYYKMRQDMSSASAPEPGASINKTDGSDQAGVSLSGAAYIPDDNVGLGIKAGVIVGLMPDAEPVNGDVTFEIQFNSSGGVNLIGFYGNVYIMTPMTKRDGTSPIHAAFGMYFDIPNSILHAQMEIYVNAGAVKGSGQDGIAGWCVLHFSPQTWYVYVGTPDNRIGISLFDALKVGGYFMVGTEIPGFPPPPKEVSDILGVSPESLDMMRDENALKSGGGFAFGASLQFDTGEKTFLIFYGHFNAGIGFDIMLKNYGNNVHCAGQTEPLGMHGWYASGQLYAYVEGEIGLTVKVFGKHENLQILSLGVAAIIQGKLPNPTWMQAMVGGRYSVLGGLVSGHCSFKLTIGKQCEIVGGNILSTVQVIQDLTPAEGTANVNVFNSPQATFNIPIEKTFELQDYDGSTRYFRARMDFMKVLDDTHLQDGKIEGNTTHDVYVFDTHDILPPLKTIKLQVQVVFEEYTNNAWNPVFVDGQIQTEFKEVSFKTGAAPDNIPHSNIAYSYPILGQFNYLKNEHPQGYINLIKGQPYLFDSDGGQWKYESRVTPIGSDSPIKFSLSYDAASKQVNYSMPQTIQNGQLYLFQLMRVPAQANVAIDANVSTTANTTKSDAGDMTVQTKTAQGTRTNLQEKEIFNSNFKTSLYSSFPEKMKKFNYSDGATWPISNGVHELTTTLTGDELFDKFELDGTTNVQPLVAFRALLGDTYYQKSISPMVYDSYPLNGNIYISDWRNPNDNSNMGVPPVKGIFIGQSDHNRMVSDGDVQGGNASGFSGYCSIVYFQVYYYYMDYYELKQKCANVAFGQGSNQRMDKLINGQFPSIQPGKYDMEISYVMPGTGEVSSTYKVVINLRN